MYAHGHYDLWRDNTVVLARIKGQWNDDMARQFAAAFTEITKPLISHDWAHISYLDEWELATPEVEPIITTLAEFFIANGLKRIAQVYNPNTLKAFQMGRMIRTSIGAFQLRAFPEEGEAFSWLKAEGFSVTRESLLPPTI